ncbi:hypothetical protein [Roseibium litorale]|nr:hypothetical protein [Roseibium litorale]
MVIPIVSGPYRTFRALTQDESFIEFEGSTITIPMKARRSPNEPWMEEIIKLRAFMRLEIYPAYVNNLGTREFQFTIRDWDLYGKSPMLNQLFYGDPRGKLVVDKKTGFADHIPAAVTFTVNHGYSLTVDEGAGEGARELFGKNSDIEIRDLCSHHLRTWAPAPERNSAITPYGNPNTRIYWQIIPASRAKAAKLNYLFENPEAERLGLQVGMGIMIFHKKAPNIPGDTAEFDIANPEDRARYLLAITTLGEARSLRTDDGSVPILQAKLPSRGFEAARGQIKGNSVISSLYRPRSGLDIRIPIAARFRSGGDFNESAEKLASTSRGEILKGTIDIKSPARSLGTADQAPDPGRPFDSADFPARITYAANYDIYINRERFVEDQAGIAIAVGAEDVPPRDVKVAFEKPQAGLVAGRFIEFSSGDCTGMFEIPMEDYRDGLNFARYWRTVPLEPEAVRFKSEGGQFEDYDPLREY